MPNLTRRDATRYMSESTQGWPSLTLSANDSRARHLFSAMRTLTGVVGEFDFDQIDWVTKYAAAALSFSYPRSEWWESFQMHPLMQSRRRRVLQSALGGIKTVPDALLMWGSWFHPMAGANSRHIPFFNYIDQSRSLEPLEGEPAAAWRRRRRSHALQGITYRDSSGIFCMSQWARSQTLESHPGIPASKVHAVGWGPCGIDLSGEEIGPRDGDPLILHVSNDFKRKGVDYLATVAARIQETHPRARFIVVGQDAGHMQVNAPSNVAFLGPIHDRRELSSLFRRASLFLLPHRFDRSPHVLVEAMSAALPFVTSAQGGPMELVQGGTAGLCVPVGDIGGYTSAVRRLLDHRDEAAALGARGKRLMLDRYNWPSVARRILAIIASTLADHREAEPGKVRA